MLYVDIYETSELMMVVQAYRHSPPADICRRFRSISVESAQPRDGEAFVTEEFDTTKRRLSLIEV